MKILHMEKAVFLDRDGILIRERGEYNYKPGHVEMVDGIVEALKELKRRGFIFIVISNQGGIAKGLYGHREVKEVNRLIREFFSDHGIVIRDFYYCPHHDQYGRCLCRKPDSLMLEKTIAKYHVDPLQSYFVGDKPSDVAAAQKADVSPVLLESNDDLGNYLEQFK